MRRLAHEVLPPLAGIVCLIAVWALIAATTTTASIPSPLAVWDALIDGLRVGTIQEAALKTLIRLVFSFVIAVVLGTGLGVL
ncbi:MAG TPA: ABC transporter permease, partial [Actinomycetota bacterium]|nr:ABC transporter permease [Actinomycetota bacterium]